MNTLIHLCRKDFTFAKPWILGAWLVFAVSIVLPWIHLDEHASQPLMMFRLLAPAALVFLASTRIIHCDPFVGTAGFMGTRPVRATTVLRNKLVLIALALVLPAVVFELLHAACLRVRLSASDYLLLFIENGLFFSLAAGVAVVASVITRGDGAIESGIVELLLVNPTTKEFTYRKCYDGSRGVGGEWNTLHETLPLGQLSEPVNQQRAEEFLKDARLYIIGTRYGGNITLPYEIPELTLEETR
jgi:hypothetical protein